MTDKIPADLSTERQNQLRAILRNEESAAQKRLRDCSGVEVNRVDRGASGPEPDTWRGKIQNRLPNGRIGSAKAKQD